MFWVLCVLSALTDAAVSVGVFPEVADSFTSILFM